MVSMFFVACSKDEEQWPTKEGASTTTATKPTTELVSFKLDNGISVYIRGEYMREMVAVEVLYRAGYFHEPQGQVQMAHIVEHMLLHSPTASYEAEAAMNALSKNGRINAEAVGDFTHYDYVVPADGLERVLRVEAERLTTVRFTQDVFDEEVTKAVSEIDQVLTANRGSLSKVSLMALNQVLNYGETHVPIYGGAKNLTLDQLHDFHKEFYRTEDMVVVMVGDLEVEEASRLARDIFGGIPVPSVARPAQPETRNLGNRKIAATWDIDAEVLYFTSTQPIDDFKDRVVLTIFGGYLSQFLSNNASLYPLVKSSFCSNQTYPVNDVPFFVFMEPKKGIPIGEVRAAGIKVLEEALASVDSSMFSRIKISMTAFMNSSLLNTTMPPPPREHYRVLGQEAVNIGMRHYVTEHYSSREMLDVMNSISYEYARRVLDKYASPGNLTEVVFRKK